MSRHRRHRHRKDKKINRGRGVTRIGRAPGDRLICRWCGSYIDNVLDIMYAHVIQYHIDELEDHPDMSNEMITEFKKGWQWTPFNESDTDLPIKGDISEQRFTNEYFGN